jgi:tetratricopeptide (TPR) repeat protein
MDSPIVLLAIGFLYIPVFGGLSLLRREGLSMRFAIESVVFTGLVTLFRWLTGVPIHPAIFLFVLYLVTMRIRLMVDIGNMFARRRNFARAEGIYNFALQLWPDPGNRTIVEVNKGTLLIQQGALDESIAMFQDLLRHSDQGFLGIRYESAAHYNLGIAYHRKGLETQAVKEFNTVLDIWPASEYARAATNMLARHSQGQKPKADA